MSDRRRSTTSARHRSRMPPRTPSPVPLTASAVPIAMLADQRQEQQQQEVDQHADVEQTRQRAQDSC